MNHFIIWMHESGSLRLNSIRLMIEERFDEKHWLLLSSVIILPSAGLYDQILMQSLVITRSPDSSFVEFGKNITLFHSLEEITCSVQSSLRSIKLSIDSSGCSLSSIIMTSWREVSLSKNDAMATMPIELKTKEIKQEEVRLPGRKSFPSQPSPQISAASQLPKAQSNVVRPLAKSHVIMFVNM